ncbi:MAG TPA: glycosyltransferase family 2 protein [Niallia sp.]|nr:glycosyltransferase family 2 protein [Niallia sp.]
MENNLVSVIIPTYNVEKYIKQCINSVLAQTHKNLEIIIVDDCSADNTLKIVQSYADSRINILINKENKGPSYSRNRAIEKAKGEWIAFLDSDDWWESTRIERLISVAEINSIQMITDDINLIFEGENKPWSTQLKNKKMNDFQTMKLTPEFFINEDLGMQPMIKRAILEENNIKFDEHLKYGEDFKLYLECLLKTRSAVLLNEPYYYYRQRLGSLMTTNKRELLTQTISTTEFLLKEPDFIKNRDVVDALSDRRIRLLDSLLYYDLLEKIYKKEYMSSIRFIIKKPKLLYLVPKRIPNIIKFRILSKIKSSN